MDYKNVGIYRICRKMKGYDADYFVRATKTELDYMRNYEWESCIAYMDEAETGTECTRSELSRMFLDAASGKLDHICIHSLYDLWHDAQKVLDMLQMLHKANPKVELSLSFPPLEAVRSPHRTTSQLILDMLNLQQMVGDLRFLKDNFHQVDSVLRNRIIQRRIDPYMMETFLLSFYLEPKDVELDDLEQLIGLSQQDIECIKLCFDPSDEGYTKLIDWVWQDLLAYFLV